MCRPRAAADDASDATDGDEIEAAKLLERPRCTNWSKDGLAKKWAQTRQAAPRNVDTRTARTLININTSQVRKHLRMQGRTAVHN